MSEFSEHVERVTQLDPSLFLGRLYWYCVSSEAAMDHLEFCQVLISNGHDRFLPPAPRPSDVFKRACTASQRKHVPTDDPKVFLNYLIREVGKDSDNIWRRLVEERVDTRGLTLGYTEVAELHFDRNAKKINVTWMNDPHSIQNDAGVPYPPAAEVIASVHSLYAAWDNTLSGYAIRELLRRLLTSLNATLVRPSGGVYFIHEQYAHTVDDLARVIDGLPGCSFHTLPLVDDKKQRAMLKQAFEDESIGEIDRILGEIGEILKNKESLTSAAFANYKVEYDRLRKKVAEYSDLLNTAMENTAIRLEMMDRVLFDLLGRVKV